MATSSSSLEPLLGPLYLGVIGSTFLFGLTCLQVYKYYTRYPDDTLSQKLFVALLWLLDAVNLSFSAHFDYHYLVLFWGDVIALTHFVWSFKLQIALNIVLTVFVQTLYVIRAWKLGRPFHRFIPCAIMLIVLAGFGIGLFTTIEIYRLQITDLKNATKWTNALALSLSTCFDFIIAIFMCVCLQRGRSEFSETNSKVARLMQYIIASGLATSACSLASLFAYLVGPQGFAFVGIELLLPKLYVNSYIAMLNTRRVLKRQAPGLIIPTSNIHSPPETYAVQINTYSVVNNSAELGRSIKSDEEENGDSREKHLML